LKGPVLNYLKEKKANSSSLKTYYSMKNFLMGQTHLLQLKEYSHENFKGKKVISKKNARILSLKSGSKKGFFSRA
jgi:hypothetical protein